MKITLAQKILYFILLGLLVLMVIFSFKSLEHHGESGFEECIQKKCEAYGIKHCNKAREISNCCLGAGGKIKYSQKGANCFFT